MQDGENKFTVVLSIPPGLEVAAVKTARREYDVRFDRLATGHINSKGGNAQNAIKSLLENAPIWTFGSFILVKRVRALDIESIESVVTALAGTVEAFGWRDKAYWLDAKSEKVRGWASQFLHRDFGLRNDPTNYDLTLKVVNDAEATFILLGPSISVRQRFSYRNMDVVASINPVLAAFLVRLLPQEAKGLAIDPTCGSGTLLFERLRYSDEVAGLGIDVNIDAEKAFKCNLNSIDLGRKTVDFWFGSSTNSGAWKPCSSVVCNLPFGIRIKLKSADLDLLYRGILMNAYQYLEKEGRILMISSYKRGLEKVADEMSDRVKVLSKYRCEMGGLFYQIFVLSRV